MNYVEEKAQAIIDEMTKRNEITTSVATCECFLRLLINFGKRVIQ